MDILNRSKIDSAACEVCGGPDGNIQADDGSMLCDKCSRINDFIAAILEHDFTVCEKILPVDSCYICGTNPSNFTCTLDNNSEFHFCQTCVESEVGHLLLLGDSYAGE